MNDGEHDDNPPEPWAVFERSTPGWWRVSLDDRAPELYLGTALGPDGKPVITALVIRSEQVTNADLRRIPLRRIEASLAMPHRVEWTRQVANGANPLREITDAADGGPGDMYPAATRRSRLQRPNGRDPQLFYGQVADAYRHIVSYSSRPAVELAEEVGVPIATARRWINRARELGLLEKGQRGRAI